MIDAAMEKPPAFTVILVHSFSRFFRDQFQFEFYVRKLAKNGVRVISITQDLGDDPMSVMMRQIMTLFDEYQSKENARQGFWNGALPPIITEEEYYAVQASLKARNRIVMPPRAVTSPVLLTGICFCASCGGAMTLRTGTGNAGGNYRYYTCSTKARQGKTGCSGNTVPMDRLDDAVVDHLESRLLHPQRLEEMMGELLDRRDDWVERRRGHIAELRKRATEAEAKLKRLYDAIENGLVDAGDSSLKDRIAELVAMRDQPQADAERAVAAVERIGPVVTAESLRTFARTARCKLFNEDGTYRRDYLRAVAQRVEVVSKNEVRVMGSRSELLRTLIAASGVEAAVTGVRGLAPKWCAQQDSNLWPSD